MAETARTEMKTAERTDDKAIRDGKKKGQGLGDEDGKNDASGLEKKWGRKAINKKTAARQRAYCRSERKSHHNKMSNFAHV